MAFLNTSKAKNILKEAKVIDLEKIVKGESAELSVDSVELAKEILNSSECKLFRTLDKAGKYLKESLLTRSTSHKTYDFASLQSESSLNLQIFYKGILNNKYVDIVDNKSPIDKKTQKEIDLLLRKMSTSLNKAISLIKKNPGLTKTEIDELKMLNSSSTILHQLDGLLPDNVAFSEEVKSKANKHYANQKFKTAAITGLAIGPLSAAAVGLLGFGGIALGVQVGLLQTGFGTAILGFVTTLVGAGIGLTIPIVIAAGFLVAGLVVLGNRERFSKIATKQEIIKINDEFRNALKYLNKAADLVRRSNKAKQVVTEEENSRPVSAEQIIIINEFLSNQKKLWEKYTTEGNRNYTNKSEKDSQNDTHKSGLRTVKDEKTSTIGKMKLGIAKTWAELKIK